MSLKKFEDFETHLAEEDKNALANDSAGAIGELRALVANGDGKILGIRYNVGGDPDELILTLDDDTEILIKVKGYFLK